MGSVRWKLENTSSPTAKFCLWGACTLLLLSSPACVVMCSCLLSSYCAAWWVGEVTVWASLWFILNICFWQVHGTTRSARWACDVAIIAASAGLCMCASVVQRIGGEGGVVPPCALLRMSHIWAPCNPIPCFTYVNRQTLCSGLTPDSLLGSEWVRCGYQQQAWAALVSASPNKGSTHPDIYKCIVYTLAPRYKLCRMAAFILYM